MEVVHKVVVLVVDLVVGILFLVQLTLSAQEINPIVQWGIVGFVILVETWDVLCVGLLVM